MDVMLVIGVAAVIIVVVLICGTAKVAFDAGFAEGYRKGFRRG